jgi:hypothetical protein
VNGTRHCWDVKVATSVIFGLSAGVGRVAPDPLLSGPDAAAVTPAPPAWRGEPSWRRSRLCNGSRHSSPDVASFAALPTAPRG